MVPGRRLSISIPRQVMQWYGLLTHFGAAVTPRLELAPVTRARMDPAPARVSLGTRARHWARAYSARARRPGPGPAPPSTGRPGRRRWQPESPWRRRSRRRTATAVSTRRHPGQRRGGSASPTRTSAPVRVAVAWAAEWLYMCCRLSESGWLGPRSGRILGSRGPIRPGRLIPADVSRLACLGWG